MVKLFRIRDCLFTTKPTFKMHTGLPTSIAATEWGSYDNTKTTLSANLPGVVSFVAPQLVVDRNCAELSRLLDYDIGWTAETT